MTVPTTTSEPGVAPPTRRLWLTLLVVACSSASGVALLLHVAGWLPLYFFLDVAAAPALVGLLAAGALAQRVQEKVLLNRLLAGVAGGAAATAAYDGTRLLAIQTGLFQYNPFLSHPIFGICSLAAPRRAVPRCWWAGRITCGTASTSACCTRSSPGGRTGATRWRGRWRWNWRG